MLSIKGIPRQLAKECGNIACCACGRFNLEAVHKPKLPHFCCRALSCQPQAEATPLIMKCNALLAYNLDVDTVVFKKCGVKYWLLMEANLVRELLLSFPDLTIASNTFLMAAVTPNCLQSSCPRCFRANRRQKRKPALPYRISSAAELWRA